jgi:hypothetical protein
MLRRRETHLHCISPVLRPTRTWQTLTTKARRIVSAIQSRITDRTGTGHRLGGTEQEPSLELVELAGALPTWARFPGRWSEGELLWAGRTPTRFTRVRSGPGPAAPKWNTTAVPALRHTDSS